MSKQSKFMCPCCGSPMTYSVASEVAYAADGKQTQKIKSRCVFKCLHGYEEFVTDSTDKFLEYCKWYEQLKGHFVIVIHNYVYPSMHIGAVGVAPMGFHKQDALPGETEEVFRPLISHNCSLRPEHMDYVFSPKKRRDAIACYQKLVKDYVENTMCDAEERFPEFLEGSNKPGRREFWEEGMDLWRRYQEHLLDLNFAQFLRFLQEYDNMCKKYPDEKEQIKHLDGYYDWLWLEGEEEEYDYRIQNGGVSANKEIEMELLKKFKTSQKKKEDQK